MSPSHAAVYPEDEASWLSWVKDAALWARPAWRFYHTRNSKGSDAGFPDVVLVRPPRLIFAELKTDTAPGPKLDSRNATLRAQAEWLHDLGLVGVDPGWEEAARRQLAGPVVETYVWRPADRPDVERILR